MPLGTPARAAGASLSDQVEAARERQHELGRSIARQDSILRELDRDQASTQVAIEDTEAQLEGIGMDQALSSAASSRPSSASPVSVPATSSSLMSCARATGRWIS